MKRIATAAALITLSIVLAATAWVTKRSDTTETVGTPARSQRIASTAPERPTGAVDELVAVDRGRLHLRCEGEGETTILLLAGWQAGDDGWGTLEPAVAERSRVCAYARFGTGTSDPSATTQTFATQAEDLHALLEAAQEPGPYLVVGHSFGGAEAVTFAARYRDEVTGVVLIDASPTTWPDAVCSVPAYADGCAVMRNPSLDPERLDVFRAFDEVATITSLGELPMTVVTADHRRGPLTPAERARLDAIWDAGVDRWASLSQRSTVVRVAHTGHDIHLEHPQLVIAEMLDLLT